MTLYIYVYGLRCLFHSSVFAIKPRPSPPPTTPPISSSFSSSPPLSTVSDFDLQVVRRRTAAAASPICCCVDSQAASICCCAELASGHQAIAPFATPPICCRQPISVLFAFLRNYRGLMSSTTWRYRKNRDFYLMEGMRSCMCKPMMGAILNFK